MGATRPEGGRTVSLPHGDVVVLDWPGPAGAPTVVLLHGLGVTADINFHRCYRPLAHRFRVLAFDHRGHGRGLRSRRRFRFADCADDAVAVAEAAGADRFVAVGYSMGGAIAQFVARRHSDRIRGVVLCATASRFNGTRAEHANFAGLTGLATLARLTPPPVVRSVVDRYMLSRHVDWADWAVEQAGRNDWRAVLEAGAALGSFDSSAWLGELTVPASVVITRRDSMVPPGRQRRLAALLPDATVFDVDGDHDAVAAVPSFPATLIDAIDSVIAKSHPCNGEL